MRVFLAVLCAASTAAVASEDQERAMLDAIAVAEATVTRA
jgi:hypothetical protein